MRQVSPPYHDCLTLVVALLMSFTAQPSLRWTLSFTMGVLLVMANMIDWSLTYIAIELKGLREVNVILGGWITTPLGFVVKLIVPAVIGWRLRNETRLLKYALVVYGLVVGWNLFALSQGGVL